MKYSEVIRWNNDGTVSVEQTTNPKKITGTKLGALLGLNPYSTPFQVWCDITHAWQKPMEDTIFTIAGKVIEPKQAQYIKNELNFPNLKTPEDLFGKNYFDKTHGNFFDDEHFGGMWDYIDQDTNGNINAVFEMKTAGKKKKVLWEDNSIPEYYALQASLYAYLLRVEQIYMVPSFLEWKDYQNPYFYKLSADNTKLISFKLHERYPYFEDEYIKPALKWWDTYVITGKSPQYDTEKDIEFLNGIWQHQKEIQQ